jgi:cobalt-zinc-cadmium efflux system protein
MGHHHHDHGSHAHSHHHADPQNMQNQKAFLLAASINFIFVAAEVIYAFIANSMSLFADAGHNFADVIGLVFSFAANWLLTKPSSKRYSYGYKKTTVLAALSNALLLIFSTGIIVYESLSRLFHPVANVDEKIMMIVAGLGILINGGTALLFIKNSAEDLNIKSAFLHLAGDALISLGVVVTGFIILWTQFIWLDALVGIIIALIILIGTWRLVLDSLNLILDAVPRHIDHEGVEKYLGSLSGVEAVHDLHIWGLSTKETALTAHLTMPNKSFISDHEFAEINQHLKKQFKIHHATLQVECGDSAHPCVQSDRC